MAKHMTEILQTPDHEWTTFPGGELEGRRSRRLCATCRGRARSAAPQITAEAASKDSAAARQPLCFQCYRVELTRERALKVAGELDTASVARFQEALPFEPVNHERLTTLKMARVVERLEAAHGFGRFVDRRRQAQRAARHALQAIGRGLMQRHVSELSRERALADAVHSAELQLPESWLPFVIAG
jgi:hypothetical protein